VVRLQQDQASLHAAAADAERAGDESRRRGSRWRSDRGRRQKITILTTEPCAAPVPAPAPLWAAPVRRRVVLREHGPFFRRRRQRTHARRENLHSLEFFGIRAGGGRVRVSAEISAQHGGTCQICKETPVSRVLSKRRFLIHANLHSVSIL
jgi:hypothetical protein